MEIPSSIEPTYNSKIIKHSISEYGNGIITWEITLPYWVIQDFNTHKVEIERNSASTRAVPINIITNTVMKNPVMPFEWRYNAKGMSPPEIMSDEDTERADKIWIQARNSMVRYARRLQKEVNADKQRVNMLMMQWLWTVVVVTMTDGGKIGINNFFGLRDRSDVRPELRNVVHMMHEQYHNSTPTIREWHLPYVNDELFLINRPIHENEKMLAFGKIYNNYIDAMKDAAIISAARCGRVTHYKQGIEYSVEDELNRGWGFFNNGHFSPLRHPARAVESKWVGNMFGWESISKIMSSDGKDYITKCCERAH